MQLERELERQEMEKEQEQTKSKERQQSLSKSDDDLLQEALALMPPASGVCVRGREAERHSKR